MIDQYETSAKGMNEAPLTLLFSRGSRPCVDDVRAIVEQAEVFLEDFKKPYEYNIDDRNHLSENKYSSKQDEINWIELVANGLSFDLIGLKPGGSVRPREFAYRFDSNADVSGDGLEALALMAGPHLSGAENSMPVIRTMMELTAALSSGLGSVSAIGWGPSRSAMGVGYFTKAVRTWLDGGPFPALGLTAFQIGADGTLRSEGLAFFSGQEIRLDNGLSADRVAGTRIAVRLINELVGSAPVESALDIAGPDGEALRLEPSADGKLLNLKGA